MVPCHYLQFDLMWKKTHCISAVAPLGPITNHYSKANLGVLIIIETPHGILNQHLDLLIVGTNLSAYPERAHVPSNPSLMSC